jgi:hypothetical protein
MASVGLTAYWLETSFRQVPLRFGVTARSLADAIAIIRAVGYSRYLPDELAGVKVTEGVTVGDVDYSHVVANMGPIAIRGMWYPFVTLGVPAWAEQRINDERHNRRDS